MSASRSPPAGRVACPRHGERVGEVNDNGTHLRVVAVVGVDGGRVAVRAVQFVLDPVRVPQGAVAVR